MSKKYRNTWHVRVYHNDALIDYHVKRELMCLIGSWIDTHYWNHPFEFVGCVGSFGGRIPITEDCRVYHYGDCFLSHD